MKILHVITQGHWGGAQRYIFDLLSNLNREFELHLAVGEAKAEDKDLQNMVKKLPNARIHQLQYLRRNISLINDIRALWEISALYRQIKPDVAHLNSSKAGIIGSLAKVFVGMGKKNKKPLTVYTAHGWVFNEPLSQFKKFFYKFLEKTTVSFKDKIVILGEKDYADAISILKVPSNKLKVTKLAINNRIHMNKTHAQTRLSDLTGQKHNDRFIIGTIANLYHTKGIDILLRAIADQKQLLPANPLFVIIGDGPERKNLEQIVMEGNLDDLVRMPGFVENAHELLPAFDLFVLPSRKEGLPYTILEAITAKIPIISTDVGSIDSVIKHGRSGLLCRPQDPEDLMQTLLYALNNKSVLRQMTENASTLLDSDFDDFLIRTANLYRSLRPPA